MNIVKGRLFAAAGGIVMAVLVGNKLHWFVSHCRHISSFCILLYSHTFNYSTL